GTALLMGYYNFRVTGTPWELPYQAWARTYSRAHGLAVSMFGDAVSPGAAPPRWLPVPNGEPQAPPSSAVARLGVHWAFYCGVLLSLPALALWPLLRQGRTRFALLTLALVWALCALEGANPQPHYSAPVTVLVVGLVVQGLRHLRGRRPGRLLAAAVLL